MKRKRLFQTIFLTFVCICAGWLLPRLGRLDTAALLRWVPSDPPTAAAVLLLLFALKGLSFFFPAAILECASGLLFPLPSALLVNLAGNAAAMTLPYLLGRGEQGDLSRLFLRRRRLRSLWELRKERHDFSFVLLLRLSGLFPGDAVSFCLGAAGISYRVALFAGLLGELPRTAAVTILGSSLTDPSNPVFFLSLALNIAVTLGAVFFWRLRRKKTA